MYQRGQGFNPGFAKASQSGPVAAAAEGFQKWEPKWIVYNGKSENKMDDVGVPPFGNIQIMKIKEIASVLFFSL